MKIEPLQDVRQIYMFRTQTLVKWTYEALIERI